MTTKKHIILTIFFCTNFIYAYGMIKIDKIIAKIGDEIILQSDVDFAYHLQTKKNNNISKKNVIEDIFLNKILLYKAQEYDIVISSEEVEKNVNRRIQDMIQQIGSKEQLIKYFDKPIKVIKKELFSSCKEHITCTRMYEKITNDITISPEEVQNFFTTISKDKLPVYPATIELAQIVRYPMVSEEEVANICEQLLSIQKEISQGNDFVNLAKDYIENINTSAQLENSNDFFWNFGDLMPAYETAIMDLNPGEVSNLVFTQKGIYLIQLIEIIDSGYRSCHIFVPYNTDNKNIGTSVSYLDSLRNSILHEGIHSLKKATKNDSINIVSSNFTAAAKNYSMDIITSKYGGFLTVNNRQTLLINEVPQEILAVIDTLAEGNISTPILFQDKNGQQGVKILYCHKKNPMHTCNIKQNYEKIYTMALQYKKEQALQIWLEKAKKDTAIINLANK